MEITTKMTTNITTNITTNMTTNITTNITTNMTTNITTNRSLTQVQLRKQSNPTNHRHLKSMGGLCIVTNAQMVACTSMPCALIPTSAPVIVDLTTTTSSTLAMILCGLFGKQIALATSSIALAPARLLLDVPVVGCGDLKCLCQLENPKGLF